MSKEELYSRLSEAVVCGKTDVAKNGAQEALSLGFNAVETINEGLVKGMSIVGDRYAAHEVDLPQVLMSAQAMYSGLNILLPAIPKSEALDRKKCAVAVVEGDVHDIGKNIVKTMMTAGGYHVFDLGKDVPISTIVDAAEHEGLDAVAMSTLMTPTMDGMRDAIDGLVESGYRSKVIVTIGGPPTSPSFAEEIGADHRDENAQNCVTWLKEAL
ncbi:MAG: corrinoid protein [Candidatus Methanoplasma sp.]|jgi:corrinoid protein of di/trimethylamine methyltransferase|nr:corrinoid protein [Candidatus Methanoplasma sp.]